MIADERAEPRAAGAELAADYERMRALAERHLARERPDHTLQPTALVHEAWLRLAAYRAERELSARETALLASRVMRRVLTDHARARNAAKREGARRARGEEAELDAAAPDGGAELVLAVDDALEELARQDAELARIVELRFFGGQDVASIARATGLAPRTVDRRWRLARAWLALALGEEGA